MNFENGWRYYELIEIYMAAKIRRGYEPIFKKEEIINFLDLATNYVCILDTSLSYSEALEMYLACNSDSFIVKDDGTIIPTYKFEIPNINKVYMTSMLNHCINHFLMTYCAKRGFNFLDSVDEKTREFCENATAALAAKIWHSKILEYINIGLWPKQYLDVEKYVLDVELATNMRLNPMRYDLLSFYKNVFSRMMRIAGDDDFQMTNYEGRILGKANFDYAMDDYDYIHYSSKFGRIINISKAANMMTDNSIMKTDNWASAAEIPLDSPEVLSLTRSINSYLGNRN